MSGGTNVIGWLIGSATLLLLLLLLRSCKTRLPSALALAEDRRIACFARQCAQTTVRVAHVQAGAEGKQHTPTSAFCAGQRSTAHSKEMLLV